MGNPITNITQQIVEKYKNSTPVQKAAVVSAAVVTAAVLSYQAIQPSDTGSAVSPTEIVEEGSEKVYTQDIPSAERILANTDNAQCRVENLPSIINMSLNWRGSLVEEGLQNISPPAILVVSAGNEHPEPVYEEIAQLSRNLNAIVVGSISPDGKKSNFSSEHEEVHIVAPADGIVTKVDGQGFQAVSGTSAAAPLVTGSLAAFEWLAGYHPTAAEAKLLLERTAVRTLSSNEEPQKNGVGMVNAYKMGMVGKKLKELCGEDKDCFKSKIQDSSTYEFPEDPSILQLVDRAFPQCSADNCSENFNICTDKAEALKSLRKAALLNSDNKELWRSLACIYKSNGFTKDAEGAMSFYKALFGPDRGDVPAYNFCSANADCTLVPASCSSSDNSLVAVTQAAAKIYHVEGCQETRLCNNKCRCSGSENVSLGTPGSFDLYTTRCVNSRCEVTKDSWNQADKSPVESKSIQPQGLDIHIPEGSSGSR